MATQSPPIHRAGGAGGALGNPIGPSSRPPACRLPSEVCAHHSLTFERGAGMAEPQVRRLIGEHGFSIANLSHHLTDGGRFEYGMVIKTRDEQNVDALSRHLSRLPEVMEFRIDPVGD